MGALDGLLYAAGGSNGPVFFATLEAYDPATDTWSSRPSMPTARNAAGAGVIGRFLYVVGGGDCCVPFTTNEVFISKP